MAKTLKHALHRFEESMRRIGDEEAARDSANAVLDEIRGSSKEAFVDVYHVDNEEFGQIMSKLINYDLDSEGIHWKNMRKGEKVRSHANTMIGYMLKNADEKNGGLDFYTVVDACIQNGRPLTALEIDAGGLSNREAADYQANAINGFLKRFSQEGDVGLRPEDRVMVTQENGRYKLFLLLPGTEYQHAASGEAESPQGIVHRKAQELVGRINGCRIVGQPETFDAPALESFVNQQYERMR